MFLTYSLFNNGMFLTHSLFSNGKSQSMDMSLRCVHALCPFMWCYGKGIVASCLGYAWHRIQEVLPAYWHDMGGVFSCNHACMNATLEVVLQHYRHSSCMGQYLYL